MKYAIFSDIHGNLPAFEAALADAKEQKVDKFLFIGDYAANYPWGNEVLDIIRNLPNAMVIKGNGEDYFITPPDANVKQFALAYWAYKNLSPENLEYVKTLPSYLVEGDIHLHHASSIFFRKPMVEIFHSHFMRQLYNGEIIPHEEYLTRAKAAILAHPQAVAEIEALPPGVYLFGHNHLQFFMEYKGRIFINPGSCGEPLEWDTTAPYTMLTYENGNYTVEERRVEYDVAATVQNLRESEFATFAPAWNGVMEEILVTGNDYFYPFLLHLAETSKAMGESGFPVSNEAFDAAASTWVFIPLDADTT